MKKLNTLENFFFSARVRVLLWLGLFPRPSFGRWRFKGNSLWRSDFDATDWRNHGSADPNYNCVFMKKNVSGAHGEILIRTLRENAVGHDYDGKKDTRKFTSGSLKSNRLFGYGTFSCRVKLSGLWDAFWALHDDADGYWEFDGIECFKKGELTTSVHRGLTSTLERVKHTNGYKQPGERVHVAMKIRKRTTKAYINGMCVFVGRIYRPVPKFRLILNSGLQLGHEINNSHYTIFENIKYYGKGNSKN